MRGPVESVLVDETRPLLQGARLTAWELTQAGVPHRVEPAAAAAVVTEHHRYPPHGGC